jgi:multidrug efflux pump subunit AcrA (membrane-fusion protein)
MRDAAQRDLEMKRAEFDAHCTGTQIAIRKMDAEKAGLVADQATAAEAADRLARLTNLPAGAVPEADRFTARIENDRRQAAVTMREANIAGIAEEMNRIAYETLALKAGLAAAEIELAQAQLALDRTRIAAPADGRVLRLMAAPGQKKMIAMDDMDSATIAILYDPAHLQVRVDVPLADAAGLGVGQRANIRCGLLPDRVFRGEVTRITGEADLQRNTLQAKVRIEDPDEKLRPEMLSRVEFLDSGSLSNQSTAAAGSALAVYIPESALNGKIAWVCDPETHRVTRRTIQPSSESRDGLRRIYDGIRPGEWIILNPSNLTENQRVKPNQRP